MTILVVLLVIVMLILVFRPLIMMMVLTFGVAAERVTVPERLLFGHHVGDVDVTRELLRRVLLELIRVPSQSRRMHVDACTLRNKDPNYPTFKHLFF